MILPGAVWGEVDGTVTNLEGRVQRIRPSIPPVGRARPLNAVLDDLAHRLGVSLGAAKVGDITSEIARLAPAYASLTLDYLTFEADEEGVIVPIDEGAPSFRYLPADITVPVVTDRMTLHLAKALYDDGVWNRHATSIADLARPASAAIHPRDASVLAVAAGDHVTIDGRYELPVQIDADVAVGSIVIPFNQVETKGLAASASVTVDPVRGDR